jgi:hypothetical protein
MDLIIVPAPRSGLNWVRFCIEKYYRRRTPGLQQLISKQAGPGQLFIRSHDALNYVRVRRKKTGSWRYIDPQTTGEAKCVLILRDPFATFVRANRLSLWKFRGYWGNIRFHTRALGEKRVVYYEDLVSDPVAMHGLLNFIDVKPAPGVQPPNLDELVETWDDTAAQSRSNYDINQGDSGGSTTKGNPTDFNFHQRKLSNYERRMVRDILARSLTQQELTLLDRYRPSTEAAPLTLIERLRSLTYYRSRKRPIGGLKPKL